jgi:hypothetical protein
MLVGSGAPTVHGVDETLGAWMHAELGEGCVVDTLPVNGRKQGNGQQVRRVVDGRGTPWVLKQVAVAREWEAEHLAYRRWVPGLADGAPELRAADRDLRALLVSEIPGAHPAGNHRRTYRKAGTLLRRLHDAEPPRERTDADRAASAERLSRLLGEARDVLTPGELAFAAEQGDAVVELSRGPAVPCHGDYRSHNWMVDESDTLRVIDFGKARWEQPAWDLAKLSCAPGGAARDWPARSCRATAEPSTGTRSTTSSDAWPSTPCPTPPSVPGRAATGTSASGGPGSRTS